MIFAVIIGAVIYMVTGILYYAILGKLWVELLKLKPEQPNYGILTLVTLLTSSLVYGVLRLAQAESLLDGALLGGAIGLIIAFAYAKDFIFGLGSQSLKPITIYFIAVGYHVIGLSLIGAVMMFFI